MCQTTIIANVVITLTFIGNSFSTSFWISASMFINWEAAKRLYCFFSQIMYFDGHFWKGSKNYKLFSINIYTLTTQVSNINTKWLKYQLMFTVCLFILFLKTNNTLKYYDLINMFAFNGSHLKKMRIPAKCDAAIWKQLDPIINVLWHKRHSNDKQTSKYIKHSKSSNKRVCDS